MSIKSEVVAMLDFLGLDEFTRVTRPDDIRQDLIYKRSDDKVTARSYSDDGHSDSDLNDEPRLDENFVEMHSALKKLCVEKALRLAANSVLTGAGLHWCVE